MNSINGSEILVLTHEVECEGVCGMMYGIDAYFPERFFDYNVAHLGLFHGIRFYVTL